MGEKDRVSEYITTLCELQLNYLLNISLSLSPSFSLQEELLAKSKAQLNEILTTTPSIHRPLKRAPVPPTTRRVATQTTVTLSCNPSQWQSETSSVEKRLRGDSECDDDSNNNRVSSTEKLKLESQIDSERTAVAALTELSNLKHESSSAAVAAAKGSHKVVTSTVLTNLVGSETLSVTPVSHQVSALQEKLKDMSQLETAAVLMDISKKVIISPPNSNPHSPPHSNASIYQRNPADRIKRTNSSDMMMDLSIKRVKMEPQSTDMQSHQQRRESVIKTERGRTGKADSSYQESSVAENSDALLNTLKNRHQLNVIKLNDSHQRQPMHSGLTVLNVNRLNNGVNYDRMTEDHGEVDDEAEEEEDMDDDSSDPGRLQVDMSLDNHHDEDALEIHHMQNGGKLPANVYHQSAHDGKGQRRGGKSKGGRSKNSDCRVPSPMMAKGNASAGITAAQLAATAMASMASAAGGPQDAHGLWHLIAQTTLNNNNGLPMSHQNKEAVQLLQQMIQNKNMQLNLAMPPMNLAALNEMHQPQSLSKVS